MFDCKRRNGKVERVSTVVPARNVEKLLSVERKNVLHTFI